MKERIVLLIISLGTIFSVNSQNLNEIESITKLLKQNAIGEISKKCIDLDNDGDNDYLFTYVCGEPECFDVYLNVNGKLKKVLHETGSISYEYENSISLKPSRLILKSNFSHCCGESPFDSYREFVFKNDTYKIIENYVKYDYENYCFDERAWIYSFIPYDFLPNSYSVKISKEKNNIRFSADLKNHNAEFVCVEQTNIIGQLKMNSIVKVLAQEKKEDKNLRTWLYVEVENSDLNTSKCKSPLTYEFKGQKLRGWISDKHTIKQ